MEIPRDVAERMFNLSCANEIPSGQGAEAFANMIAAYVLEKAAKKILQIKPIGIFGLTTNQIYGLVLKNCAQAIMEM